MFYINTLDHFQKRKIVLDNYHMLVYTNNENKNSSVCNIRKNDCFQTKTNYRKKWIMMPLSMVKQGEPNTIRRVGGKEETRRFIENLGFVAGTEVTVVSVTNGNMIVNVKDSRVAIGRDMANKIMVG